MHRALLTTVIALAAGLALTACGGGDDGPDGAAADDGAAVTVELSEFVIDAPATASAGTFVVTNTGELPHTFTADDGAFDTGTVAAGESATITIAQPGTHAYTCTIHPGQMNGTIEVS